MLCSSGFELYSRWVPLTKLKPLGEGSKRYPSYMQRLAQLLNKDLT